MHVAENPETSNSENSVQLHRIIVTVSPEATVSETNVKQLFTVANYIALEDLLTGRIEHAGKPTDRARLDFVNLEHIVVEIILLISRDNMRVPVFIVQQVSVDPFATAYPLTSVYAFYFHTFDF